MSDPNPVTAARSRVGVAARRGTPAEVAAARRALTLAKLERAIWEAITDANPPSVGELTKVARHLEAMAKGRVSNYHRAAISVAAQQTRRADTSSGAKGGAR